MEIRGLLSNLEDTALRTGMDSPLLWACKLLLTEQVIKIFRLVSDRDYNRKI